MTIEGALKEIEYLKNDLPAYYVPVINKIIEAVSNERNEKIILQKAFEFACEAIGAHGCYDTEQCCPFAMTPCAELGFCKDEDKIAEYIINKAKKNIDRN